MFFKGSRYAKVARLTRVDDSGRVVTYTAVRRIPDTIPLVGHRVIQSERLDHIAWAHFRDAERYWRICDADVVMWPDDLLEPGTIIGIPGAEG